MINFYMIDRLETFINIMTKLKNILDKIASRHDTCYAVGKNKNDCDRIMVKEIDNIPYKEKPWGTAMIRSIVNTKQRFGMGSNFTMEDLSNELNKPVINKFERKKGCYKSYR